MRTIRDYKLNRYAAPEINVHATRNVWRWISVADYFEDGRVMLKITVSFRFEIIFVYK